MQQGSGEGAVTPVDLPWEGTSRLSPPLLAGFPETEAQGELSWAGMYLLGMSQVKTKSQQMEGRDMFLWGQTGTARGRHQRTKEMTGRKNMQDARGKNMEGQKKKIRGKLFYWTKKIVMRENRKRKKPSETDSKFKMQEKKTKRRNKDRSNHMEHWANATPTCVQYCYHSSHAAILQQQTPSTYNGRAGSPRPIYRWGNWGTKQPLNLTKATKQGSSKSQWPALSQSAGSS